ncbi:2-polyprenyl-3-methyl-5-hydroxy-6-metoxy-1,4-benzoquinol methylase [Lipingzhangella halophila]|uniref:2-polyprenyl-3-methyl-5-hydroxy-6-metoxy-1, 4-benzoquinol methylase n=1 Tax=Lipingzhangella halophila TaxID=1783352 RepID=A0A7W7RGR3_9ACTN|nr:class I SAM-dependent methyltransferase [Lipingzhangella halophila]MBB4931669.1 2-polyprenyl-3-methyl-5-hydroxy-6-metoxy-1,4-benzoquinol methylase [Lipingzhangella halophila]
MALLASIDRFNQRHPWSHNDFYGRWVADRVASSRAHHVLDVGCGTGNLIDRLRLQAASVTGLEPDTATARIAADRFAGSNTVTIEPVSFADHDPRRQWDAITLVAVLHHLPLTTTLQDLRAHLSPGGRLVIIGCYRQTGAADTLVSAVATIANLAMGFLKHPTCARRLPPHMRAPTAAPSETLDEIRARAAAELPGSRIHRRLFWRYSLVYDRPANDGPH